MDSLRKQLGNTVNVELMAAPALNLGAIMDEMRQKYEVLAQENLKKAKEEFEIQVILKNKQMCRSCPPQRDITLFLPSFLSFSPHVLIFIFGILD